MLIPACIAGGCRVKADKDQLQDTRRPPDTQPVVSVHHQQRLGTPGSPWHPRPLYGEKRRSAPGTSAADQSPSRRAADDDFAQPDDVGALPQIKPAIRVRSTGRRGASSARRWSARARPAPRCARRSPGSGQRRSAGSGRLSSSPSSSDASDAVSARIVAAPRTLPAFGRRPRS